MLHLRGVWPGNPSGRGVSFFLCAVHIIIIVIIVIVIRGCQTFFNWWFADHRLGRMTSFLLNLSILIFGSYFAVH